MRVISKVSITGNTLWELWIFSNKHYWNKNDRSHSVLAASKLKALSRERLVKPQADLNESPFPWQRLPWINFQSFSCCDQHFLLLELPFFSRFFCHCWPFLCVSYFNFDSYWWRNTCEARRARSACVQSTPIDITHVLLNRLTTCNLPCNWKLLVKDGGPCMRNPQLFSLQNN